MDVGTLVARSMRKYRDRIALTGPEGDITFDSNSLNPMMEYYDDANKYHQIWYLDAVTFFNQVEIAEDL